MIKRIVVMAVAAVGIVGAALADAPKADPRVSAEATLQAEILRAWQQGFEQGYQRAMTYRDNQQMQQRKRFMAKRAANEGCVKSDGEEAPQARCTEGKSPKLQGKDGRQCKKARRKGKGSQGKDGVRKGRHGKKGESNAEAK